jgi:GcrA cell cycle regulator
MGENAWTDDGVALLRKLWAEGATADAIGRRLGGLSRSAVLGKVFRLRLDGEGAARPIERASSEREAPGRRRGRQPRRRTAAPPPRVPGRLTVLDLNNESCRWPCGRSGRIFFCGIAEADVIGGIPYCPRHMRRAYSESVSFAKKERANFVPGVKSPNRSERS